MEESPASARGGKGARANACTRLDVGNEVFTGPEMSSSYLAHVMKGFSLSGMPLVNPMVLLLVLALGLVMLPLLVVNVLSDDDILVVLFLGMEITGVSLFFGVQGFTDSDEALLEMASDEPVSAFTAAINVSASLSLELLILMFRF